MVSRSVQLAALSSAVCISCADAPAQCVSEWLPGPTVPGLDGAVTAMTKWDPDGAGPLSVRLVVGGSFATAGPVVAGPFASWDGVALQNVSAAGFSTCRPPTLLATHKGKLIAGAYRMAAGLYTNGCGGNLLFEWNGASWTALGGGIHGFPSGSGFPVDSARVDAVLTFQGDLIVGGTFTKAGSPGPGGVAVKNIARWNGVSWSALGEGLGGIWGGGVSALAIFQGQLIAAGSFEGGVARWNGATWQTLGGGIAVGSVTDLIVHDSMLVAAGYFSEAGGQPAAGIARWDGVSWSEMGGGANGPVWDLTVYNGQLVAGGDFSSAGGQPTRGIARWNGSSWKWLGAGIGSVSALEVYKGLLIAGGGFAEAGGTPASNIAAWNGATAKWSALASGSGTLPGRAYSLGSYAGDVVAAGWFTTPQGNQTNVVRRDGASWKPLGSGLILTGPGSVHGGWGLTVRTYRDELIVAGTFRRVDGVQALNIARWNGAAWLPLGLGTNQAVMALEEYGGDLIAAGRFGKVGTPWIPAGRIARWDGDTHTWHPLGAGVTGVEWGPPFVYALAVYDGDLIAGGNFTAMGGHAANHIARWDGGAWSALGVGLEKEPHALTVYDGMLYAPAGFHEFREYGAIYRWNGTSWWYMTPEFYGAPGLMQVFRGALHGAGGYDTSVLRFDGTSWSAMPDGGLGPVGVVNYYGYGWIKVPPSTYAMTVHDGELHLAGTFTVAGNQPSVGLARFGCACYADCNNDHVLSPADVVCFSTQHATAHPYADCDNDGQHTFADLTCFQLKFAAGCP